MDRDDGHNDAPIGPVSHISNFMYFNVMDYFKFGLLIGQASSQPHLFS